MSYYCASSYSVVVYYHDVCASDWYVAAAFQAFLDVLYPPNLEPNPLTILMRAINCVRICRIIHQPCWSARRWKSLT